MLHREESDWNLFDWMCIVDKYIIYSEHAKAGEWIKQNGCSVCDFSWDVDTVYISDNDFVHSRTSS